MNIKYTEVIYYDCTNFFFERDGIPLAICINPGNTSEQVTLKPIEKRIVSDYGMSKFIVCTDAGLSSKANRKFNDIQDRAFYKERWIDRGTFEEKIIVTFSLKYQNYQRKIRQGQVDRAQRAIDNRSAKRGKKNQNDFLRFISRQNSTDDGEIADNVSFSLDQDRIAEEEMYDGFYAVCTNIDDDPNKIISINQQRWDFITCFQKKSNVF